MVQTKFGCSMFIVFRRWEEKPNGGYIKLAYCSMRLPITI